MAQEHFGYELGSFHIQHTKQAVQLNLFRFFAERGPDPKASPDEPQWPRRDRRNMDLVQAVGFLKRTLQASDFDPAR